MGTTMHATKLVVRDVAMAERFYTAIGMNVISRNLGGDGDVRQQQSWLSATGAEGGHILILTRFVELPVPSAPSYPGEIWLCFLVDDVDATTLRVESLGGAVVRAGEDRPEHQVRAAIVKDNEGHFIELVGPIKENTTA